jgi:hypothetical protein
MGNNYPIDYLGCNYNHDKSPMNFQSICLTIVPVAEAVSDVDDHHIVLYYNFEVRDIDCSTKGIVGYCVDN